MNRKWMVAVAAAFVCGSVLARADRGDFDLCDNDIGDSRLLTIGGYTFAKPVSIVLLPEAATNEFGGKISYSVMGQVIYKDMIVPRPGEGDIKQVQLTGELLNVWLRAFVQGECEGSGAEEICANYRDFVVDVQERFPDYVASRIMEMAPESRICVEAVTVEIQAEGVLRRDLYNRIDRTLR